MGKTSIVAVGDVVVNRENPDSSFDLVRSKIKQADIAFCQIETPFSARGSVNPSGTFTTFRAHPSNVKGIANAGFNIGSFASNHCMDWGFEAFADTIEYCNAAGIKVFGAGSNLAEARKPLIVENNGNRIGWLAYCSILARRYAAEVRRPGCAPARAHTLYQPLEIDQPGVPPRVLTYPDEDDLQAMLSDIRQLKESVDIVIVSMHWGIHFKEGEIAMYEKAYGHQALDAGADIILGHHAHILKPIEIYRGKPLFYGLNMFTFDLVYTTDDWNHPERAARREALHPGWKLDPKYPTFPWPVDSRKTILVNIECENKKVKRVSWNPVIINQNNQPGCLRRSDPEFEEVLNYMKRITKGQNFSTGYKVEGDEVVMVQ